jgi:hypothetical protein
VPSGNIGEDENLLERKRPVWILALQRRNLGTPTQHLHKDGKQLACNSWQTIFQAARDRNTAIEKQAQRKNQCCTTLATINTGDVTKIRTRVFKKTQGGKKKSRVCISSG